MAKLRNSEELAQQLDDLLGSSHPNPDLPDDPVMSLANELSALPRPQLGADAKARMLQKVQQASQASVPSPPNRSKPVKTIRFSVMPALRWVAVLIFAIAMTSTVTYPAMADSLPGDLLFPVKLTVESVEVSLANNDVDRANIYLRQAERRLIEAGQLSADNPAQQHALELAIMSTNQAYRLNIADDILQSQVQSTAVRIQIMINRAENVDVESLSAQILQVLPTIELTADAIIVETDQPEPTHTEAPTAEPTETDAPDTATPTDEPTETDAPDTETPTAEPTETDTPVEALVVESSFETYIGVISATANVNVRTLPSPESDITLLVSPGTIISVIGESIDGQWVQIQLEDGTVGWVAGSLVEEGTVPAFTIESVTVDEPSDDQSGSPNSEGVDSSPDVAGDDSSSDSSSGGSDSGATNQGNDGINKFGCDGQGNSCNNGNGNSGNNGNGNSGNNGNGNSGNNGNGNGGNNGNGNSGNNGNGNSGNNGNGNSGNNGNGNGGNNGNGNGKNKD